MLSDPGDLDLAALPCDDGDVISPVRRKVVDREDTAGRLNAGETVGRQLPVPDPHIAAAAISLVVQSNPHSLDIIPRMQRARAACSVWFAVGMPSK